MTRISLVVLLLAACTQDVDVITQQPDNPADVDPPADPATVAPMSEAALSSSEQTAFNYFVGKGLTQVQSAGIVGNLIQESNVIASAVEFGGGPGRGIAQWSVGGRWDTSSGDNVTAYSNQQGVSRWTLSTQLDFIWFELSNFSGYGLASLKAATTVSAATNAFMTKYEICGTCNASGRVSYANQVLAAFGSSGGTSGGGGNTGSECFSGTLDAEEPDNACVQSKYDNLWYQCDNGSWVDRWSDPDACNGVHPL